MVASSFRLLACASYRESPDGAWVNWSITRGMVDGKQPLVGPTMAAQDIGVIRKMWQERGKDTPFALCFGVPPTAIMVSGMPIPKGVNEGGFVGGLLGQPVEVVKCETNDIWVPRNAEIVIEGAISSTDIADEGPFVEDHGHAFPGKGKPAPVFNVNAITFREDPILPICVSGRATEDSPRQRRCSISARHLACRLKWSRALSSLTASGSRCRWIGPSCGHCTRR